ncbi:DUF1588 domain-containing protein [Lignipirellula cremea]|nr:DUF1588 domain-containing protein [Lignipirellula cremea]
MVSVCYSRPLLAVLVLGLLVARASSAETSPPAFVSGFLRTHCLGCHGADLQEGGFDGRLLLQSSIGTEEAAALWLRVLEQTATGNMPPAEETQPDLVEIGRLVQAVRGELLAAGKARALAFPDKGNLLPHGVLFGPENSNAVAVSPARIWRISPHQYTAIGSTMIGRPYRPAEGETGVNRAPAPPFSLRGGDGLQDYSALYRLDEAQTEQLLLNARVLAKRTMAGEGNKLLAQRLSPLADRKEKLSDEQVRIAVDDVCSTILDRLPTEDERTRYGNYLQAEVDRFGNRIGLENIIAAVLMSPHALFRMELGAESADPHGRVRLTPQETATAIAYALTDSHPDRRMQEGLRNGRLETTDDVRREVERLLDDKRSRNERVLRFFREYFGYDAAPEVFKDEDLLRPEVRRYLVTDTDHLVRRILEQDRDVLKQLLTTQESFVMISALRMPTFRAKQAKDISHPFDRKNRVNEVYNMAAEDWTVEQPMTLSPERRSGVLTQPSWLIAHSKNDGNDAIHRGKWIRERLLGGSIPDTPITVAAQLPDEPHSTLREKMRVTREQYCWRCHQRMDPLGLPFEMFDHWGRFRTEELGQPVDSTGAILAARGTGLEGPVDNGIDLLHRLAESEHVEQVFVRHAFRYWMGRNEEPHDAPTLQAAWRAYHDNHGSMRALLVSLLTSDSFLYRTRTTGS